MSLPASVVRLRGRMFVTGGTESSEPRRIVDRRRGLESRGTHLHGTLRCSRLHGRTLGRILGVNGRGCNVSLLGGTNTGR